MLLLCYYARCILYFSRKIISTAQYSKDKGCKASKADIVIVLGK